MKNLQVVSILSLFVATLTLSAVSKPPYAKRIPAAKRYYNQNITEFYSWMINEHDPDLHKWIKDQNNYADQNLKGGVGPKTVDAIKSSLEQQEQVDSVLADLFHSSRSSTIHRAPHLKNWPMHARIVTKTKNYNIHEESVGYQDMYQVTVLGKGDEPTLGHLKLKFYSIVDRQENSFFYTTDRDARNYGATQMFARHTVGNPDMTADDILYEAKHKTAYLGIYGEFPNYYVHESSPADDMLTQVNVETLESQTIKNFNDEESRIVGVSGDRVFFMGVNEELKNVLYQKEFRKNEIEELYRFPLAATIYGFHVNNDLIFVDYTLEGTRKWIYINAITGEVVSESEDTYARAEFFALDDKGVVVTFADNGAIHLKNLYNSRSRSTTRVLKEGSFELVTEEKHYKAHDGRLAPMWIHYKKGTVINRNTPAYLYGYGGFGISMSPAYGKLHQSWYEAGGITVTVVLPGGGEFDYAWRKAGMLFMKENVFHDFARSAIALNNMGISQPRKMAIGGASNGGLLVSATAMRYPWLFRAAIPEVGVHDMVDYEAYTAGKYWTQDYGRLTNYAEFRNMYRLSPIHNLRRNHFPATLVIVGNLDDRVVPHHSYRYAAKLQYVQRSSRPVYLHTVMGASHFMRSKKPSENSRKEINKLSFLAKELGVVIP